MNIIVEKQRSADSLANVNNDGDEGEHANSKPIILEDVAGVVILAALAIITFINVLVRYFSSASFAFTEEVSGALLVLLTFIGSSAALVRNAHLRIEYLVNKLSPNGRICGHRVTQIMIALFFVAVCVLGAITAFNDYRYEVTTPALYLPQWIYTVWLPLLSALMVFRTCQSIVESFRERN